MSATQTEEAPAPAPTQRRRRRACLRMTAWGCGGLLALLGLLVGGVFLLLNRVPRSYPEAQNPIPPPEAAEQLGGGGALPWVEAALDARRLDGSPAYRQRGAAHSLGPALDAVSFHVYEGLDSALKKKARTVEVAFGELQGLFEKWEQGAAGFHYTRKRDYWHTEGNYDFLGAMSARRRAAWRMQFFTRAFAAGIRKVCVMDANPVEQAAVRAYVQALPNPFPMRRAREGFQVVGGEPVVYLHEDGREAGSGRVWVMWAKADTGDAAVQAPCERETAEWVSIEGRRAAVSAADGRVLVKLRGDKKMAPPVLLIDRPVGKPGNR